MGTYSEYKTDERSEREGILLKLPGRGCFLLARAGGNNQKYKEMLRRLSRPYLRQINAGTLDPEIADEIAIKSFSRTVILHWYRKGDELPDNTICGIDVTGPDGTPIPYSPDACQKLLTDLPDLFVDLQAYATDVSNFLAKNLEDEGND